VPHDGDFYYWNTTTDQTLWDHPGEPKKEPDKDAPKQVFTEEHRILWTDLGRIIGRQGLNLKIIKASIGCNINVPRQGRAKGGEKGGKDKGKGKGKGKDKAKQGALQEAREKGIGRGIGTGESKLDDDLFVNVTVTADTAYAAKGGKRCLEVMLGYGRSVEAALGLLGVEVKMPSFDEMTDGKASDKKPSKDSIDPMDPASYSDAPVGTWSNGMKKTGGGPGGRNEGRPSNSDPPDAKTANAERF